MSLSACSKVSVEVGLTFQASVETPILTLFGFCPSFGVVGVWALSPLSARVPTPRAAAIPKSRRSNVLCMTSSPFLFFRQFSAWRRVGIQVTENELRGGEDQLLHL